MTLPWWLEDHEGLPVRRVLQRLAQGDRQQFELEDADIVSRLFRNRYAHGEIESTVIGQNGPIMIEVVSNGLTDLGRRLLIEVSDAGAPELQSE